VPDITLFLKEWDERNSNEKWSEINWRPFECLGAPAIPSRSGNFAAVTVPVDSLSSMALASQALVTTPRFSPGGCGW